MPSVTELSLILLIGLLAAVAVNYVQYRARVKRIEAMDSWQPWLTAKMTPTCERFGHVPMDGGGCEYCDDVIVVWGAGDRNSSYAAYTLVAKDGQDVLYLKRDDPRVVGYTSVEDRYKALSSNNETLGWITLDLAKHGLPFSEVVPAERLTHKPGTR